MSLFHYNITLCLGQGVFPGKVVSFQVKDVDTGELVPVSEYKIKDSILPQVPGTQLVSKDIFTRLGGGYEVATPYTEVQDPMTTVLVKRVLFNTVLNAVLEDGTVIKQ